MRQLLGIAIILCLAWLAGRLMAKLAMQQTWIRIVTSVFLILGVMVPNLIMVIVNATSVWIYPPLQLLLALATLWLGLQCLLFLRHTTRTSQQARSLQRFAWAYAAFTAILLALHPLTMDLMRQARAMDQNSNGDSLPMLVTWTAARHLALVAFASALAAWHRNKGRLSWRILLPWPKGKGLIRIRTPLAPRPRTRHNPA